MPKYQGDAYLRLSYSADRSVESDSIANQKKLIEDFVAAHPDIELVSERVDDGYSGVLFDRPALKDLYTERAEQAQEAIDRLRDEMELVTNNSSSRLRWTQHFKEFSAMTTLDRRAVIAMVQSIRANGKNDLVITFRYLIEYIKVLKRLDRLGKLTPDLREILNTLTAEEKEAA